ncbi:MAG: hypothetical protein AB3N28_02605 [Kordiimonas sp.]
MPDTFSMTAILTLFYVVFLSQIFLLSIYYPGKIRRRVTYILEQFPVSEYPKLYPSNYDQRKANTGSNKLRVFMGINYTIALVGLLVLAMMMKSGYRPAPEGGDEIFVMLYFFLQSFPLFYAELKEYKYHKAIRENYTAKTRTAELKPRRLFDFVSPIGLGAAVILFTTMMILYISSRDFSVQPNIEIYATIIGMTGAQVMFAAIVASHLYGKKINPYMSYEDQLTQIKVVANIMLFASIGASVFMTVTHLVDEYSLEVIDPVLSSVYFQFCVVFGVGFAFRTLRIEKLNLEGFRETNSAS